MIGSILVRMPELTKNYSKLFGVKVINKYFVRVKGDVYIPIFNIPLLNPKVFRERDGYKIAGKLARITYGYYEKYLELRKQKQFEISVYLPEKYGGNALYYILQKFMIGEATPKEIEIVSEFLSRNIFDRENIDMDSLLYQYYTSIWMYYANRYNKSVLINTPVGDTPLYVPGYFLNPHSEILTTVLEDYINVAFVNVLTSHFFGKSIQIGSTKFRFLKSIGDLDLNWKNVKVISFKELYDISDAIIENNLKITHPKASFDLDGDVKKCKDVFLSHSPILSAVGNAIDFKNKSVMFLFAMLKRDVWVELLTNLNNLSYLNDKNIEFFVTSIPFKSIKRFIYKIVTFDGVFIIEENGKTLPVLSLSAGFHWFGVGRENIVMHCKDCDGWYGLLRRLAFPEHLEKAEEKTLEWLKINA